MQIAERIRADRVARSDPESRCLGIARAGRATVTVAVPVGWKVAATPVGRARCEGTLRIVTIHEAVRAEVGRRRVGRGSCCNLVRRGRAQTQIHKPPPKIAGDCWHDAVEEIDRLNGAFPFGERTVWGGLRCAVGLLDFLIHLVTMHSDIGRCGDTQFDGFALDAQHAHDDATVNDDALTGLTGQHQHGDLTRGQAAVAVWKTRRR